MRSAAVDLASSDYVNSGRRRMGHGVGRAIGSSRAPVVPGRGRTFCSSDCALARVCKRAWRQGTDRSISTSGSSGGYGNRASSNDNTARTVKVAGI